eukprot:886269-Amphidinium_carterae.1
MQIQQKLHDANNAGLCHSSADTRLQTDDGGPMYKLRSRSCSCHSLGLKSQSFPTSCSSPYRAIKCLTLSKTCRFALFLCFTTQKESFTIRSWHPDGNADPRVGLLVNGQSDMLRLPRLSSLFAGIPSVDCHRLGHR